jgi:hypothetical protein
VASFWQSLKKIISDDSMSIALLLLFLVCIAAQGLSGWLAYDQALQQAGFPAIALPAYLGTGDFLDAALVNWQAATLQLAVLVAFSSVLRQKGAAHSRKGDDERPAHWRRAKWKLRSKPTVREWLYANSLSLALLVMFVVLFALHVVFGHLKHNETQALRHLPPAPLGSYVVSAEFWFSVFQTWEAELALIGIYIVLSIFLRQEGSPESKPVDASDDQTGGPNE